MRRDFSAFSDHDFELFTAELLHAEEGRRYEVFTRGPDEGIDLRYQPPSRKRPYIVQCKHKPAGTYSQLKTEMRGEATKLKKMEPRPNRYSLFTTLPLTPNRKRELVQILTPFVKSTGDILGLDEVSTLVSKHPAVERNNPKLWLRSGAQLKRVLHAATFERSRQLLADINEQLPRFVKIRAMSEAVTRSAEDRVLLISGPPGIGKSTLAKLVLLDAAADGFEPIEISTDIDEANSVLDRDSKQIFYYDDFLGTTFIHDRLSKNEEARLTRFIRDVEASPKTRFILTTREYILLQAVQLYEEFERAGLDQRRYLLELDRYSRLDKARILYNHVWISDQVNSTARRLLASDRGYLKIVDHEYFNPRVIEYVTGLASRTLSNEDNSNFVDFARSALDNPSLVWRQAFDNQLSDAERATVVMAATLPSRFDMTALEAAIVAFGDAIGSPFGGSEIRAAVKSVGESFLESARVGATPTFELVNPSLVDFVAQWLAERTRERAAAVESAVAFEQLRWLQRYALTDSNGHATADVLAKFEDATIRAMDAEPLRLAVNFEGSTQPSWHKPTLDAVDRLRFALAHSDRYVVSDRFEQEIATRVQGVVDSWRKGHSVSFEGSRKLLDELLQSGRADSETLQAFKTLTFRAYWPRDWDVALDFADSFPEAFDQDERETLAEEFDTAFNASIESADDADSTADLEEYFSVAESHGRQINEDAYDDAIASIEKNISMRGEPDWDDDDRHRGEPYVRESGSVPELDALFGRLAAE